MGSLLSRLFITFEQNDVTMDPGVSLDVSLVGCELTTFPLSPWAQGRKAWGEVMKGVLACFLQSVTLFHGRILASC